MVIIKLKNEINKMEHEILLGLTTTPASDWEMKCNEIKRRVKLRLNTQTCWVEYHYKDFIEVAVIF